MEAVMATGNTQTSIAPGMQPGLFGRLMERLLDCCTDGAMFRIAPTRKM
jgi:hypothetical protein